MTCPHNVEAAGVRIVADGYKRPACDVAHDFIVACARYDMDASIILDDLAELLAAYGNAANAGGPIIAPLTYGGDDCLCQPDTESWCRAIGCPRER